MLKRIIFYRHGERSDLAPAERKVDYDIAYDPPLTSLGHLQAEAAAIRISELLGNNKSIKLVSSPMIRCVQTIEKLSKILQVPVYLQNGFGEAFQDNIGNPFERLHVKHIPEAFPLSVQVIEEESLLNPSNPEGLAECTERMRIVCEKYFFDANAEVLVICTHLYPM